MSARPPRPARPLATLALAWAAVLLPGGVGAQAPTIERPPGPLFRDLERSAVFNNVPEGRPDGKTNDIYEAYLATHFSLAASMARADSAVLRVRPRRWHAGTALTLTMGVNLRQTWESSAPVRTPSYLPKLTWQRAWTRRDTRSEERAERNRSGIASHTLSLTLGHYSNGQDGCLFVGQEPRADAAGADTTCRFPAGGPEPRPGARRVNRHDGSFSSHYLQAGWSYRRTAPADSSVRPAGPFVVAGRQWLVEARWRDYRPLAELPGGMDAELRDAYGPARARLRGSYTWLRQRGLCDARPGKACDLAGALLCLGLCAHGPGQLRVESWVEGIVGGPPEVPPVRLALEVGRTYYRRANAGPFARLYHGQDDYNLGFLTRITVLQLGIAIDPERLPIFAAAQ